MSVAFSKTDELKRDRADLVRRALRGARLACGVAPDEGGGGDPARVRVLAAASLFRGGFLPGRAAVQECGVGDASRVSPSRVADAGVTPDMILAVAAYLTSGAEPTPFPDPRDDPERVAARRARCQEARRLYVDEGLSLEEAGKRLDPPASIGSMAQMLEEIGVPRRPSSLHYSKPEKAPTDRPAFKGGKRTAPKNTSIRRFASAEIDPEQAMDLRADHPALAEARTIFPSTVVGAPQSLRLLVSGHNNPKLGKEVTKGERAGWPIFHLTLEERATCPASCVQWRACYGNAMHMARRHRADAELMAVLKLEVAAIAKHYLGGFLVRLHTLGDFFSAEYVYLWAELLAAHPQLHVFGYTARRIDSPEPESRKIAQAIAVLTERLWARFSIRTSHPEIGPQRSVVVMRDPERDDVIVCPAQSKATECCGSCGLCWSPNARDKTIAFLKHGMTSRGKRGPKPRIEAASELEAPAQPDPQNKPFPQPRGYENRPPPIPEQVRLKIMEALPALYAEHPDGVPIDPILRATGATYNQTIIALGKLSAAGTVQWVPGREPKTKVLLPPGIEPPRGELTGYQTRVLAAAYELAVDGLCKADFPAISRASGVKRPAVSDILWALHRKGYLEPVGGRAVAPDAYRILRAPERPAATPQPARSTPQPARSTKAEGAAPARRAPLPELEVEAKPRPRAGLPLLPTVAERVRGLERVKPLNADVIRWSRAYVARGVKVSYLAGLFDVDADELAQAIGLRPREARAYA